MCTFKSHLVLTG